MLNSYKCMTRKTIPNDYGKQGENHSILVHDDCNHNRLLITVYTVRKISASSLNLPVLYLLSEYTVRDGNLNFFFLLGRTVTWCIKKFPLRISQILEIIRILLTLYTNCVKLSTDPDLSRKSKNLEREHRAEMHSEFRWTMFFVGGNCT